MPAHAQNYTFPAYTVTNVLIVPSDVNLDPEYPTLVSEAVRKVQTRYQEVLGKTFRINEANDTIVVKSKFKLREICVIGEYCNAYKVRDELSALGFPKDDFPVILNYFFVGSSFRASGWWGERSDSGNTQMGDYVISSLKGSRNREQEIFCEALLGRKCSEEYGLYIIAHELGHAFGLSDASRWAIAHPCSTLNPEFCEPDLDPKFRPGPEESNRSIMGYGINTFRLNIEFNDSCVNPEKTLLRNSKYFGGPGYQGLNFENCLKETITDLGEIKIEGRGEALPGETIVIQVEGLIDNDKNIRVLFPQDNPARGVEKFDVNKLRVVVPANTASGDIVVLAAREGAELRSKPLKIAILDPSPILDRVELGKAQIGDIVTLYGSRLLLKSGEFQTSRLINIGGTRIPESQFLEYTNEKIMFRIPKNMSLGLTWIDLETILVNPASSGFERIYAIRTNQLGIEITGSSSIEARIEKSNQDLLLGETVTFKTTISAKTSKIRSAELWLRILGVPSPLCDDVVKNGLCRIGVYEFDGSKQVESFSSIYTPKGEIGPHYNIVVNVYTENGKCSGDQERPDDWVDCGPESRLGFNVSAAAIEINALVMNTSEKQIEIWWSLCSVEGTGACWQVGESRHNPGGTSLARFLENKDFNQKFFHLNDVYKFSCRVIVGTAINGGFAGQQIGECPEKEIVTERATQQIDLNIEFSNKGLNFSFSPLPTPAPVVARPGEIKDSPLPRGTTEPLVSGCRLSVSSEQIKAGEAVT